ncbi:hypothetical protein DL765_007499 [Monosporascus sp. GIB2]|nr:hypothetical protein DL765_007499 [Monosporascus sp. GIB2]
MTTEKPDSQHDGLRVIHVALFRMATRSSAEAYRILGYKTHHGLDDVFGMPWPLLEKAAEATWPTAPGARPRPPFTRADWDELWGSQYDIATDMASPFADQLISAYPDAKVVIVQRDFESWWPSYRSELLDTLFSPVAQVAVFLLEHVMGIRSGPTMRKVHFGFFGAKDRAGIEANARAAYDAYYKRIREMVPLERRLEYSMGDGWEPLCAFLGKEVPDVPFPRMNERKAHRAGDTGRKIAILLTTVRKAGAFLLPAAVLGAALWYSRTSAN